MIGFFGSFLQYVIIALILCVFMACGAFVGVKLRKNKDAKEASEEAKEN